MPSKRFVVKNLAPKISLITGIIAGCCISWHVAQAAQQIQELKPTAISTAPTGSTATTMGSATAAIPQHLWFVGDVMLSRNVDKEIEATPTQPSPWKNIATLFPANSVVVGNFEGTVGAPGSRANCSAAALKSNLCFTVKPQYLDYLRAANFRYLSLENNHASDLGAAAIENSKLTLQAKGLIPLTLEDSPTFLQLGDANTIISLVAYNEIGNDKLSLTTRLQLAQKLNLARALSNLVVVYVHWGAELSDWPTPAVRTRAQWLIEHGADMIIGHHPHVIQQSKCVAGKPVILSLGNHIFDQKYPVTKEGLAIDCSPSEHAASARTHNKLICQAYKTIVPLGSSFPNSYKKDPTNSSILERCPATLHATLHIGNQFFKPRINTNVSASNNIGNNKLKFQPQPLHIELWDGQQHKFTFPATTVLKLFAAQLQTQQPGQPPTKASPLPSQSASPQPALLLSLQKQYSPIDQENAPRPYVYAIGTHGLVAKWRGSALAWPLLDITTIRHNNLDYLCALHRGDSFVKLEPHIATTKTQVYQWNNFGFSGIDNGELNKQCSQHYQNL